MDSITQDYLKEVLEYKNGNLYWRKILSRHGKINKMVGCNNGKNYLKVGINKKYYYVHKLIFLYHYGYMPKTIDHIDRNPLNNSIENLREVTDAENSFNRGMRSDNKSNFKGVSFHKKTKKWQSEICFNYKTIYLGLYITKEEAAKAYNEAAIKHFKKFAFINKL